MTRLDYLINYIKELQEDLKRNGASPNITLHEVHHIIGRDLPEAIKTMKELEEKRLTDEMEDRKLH